MKVLIINGPNLNLLGIREPSIYGHTTYQDLCDTLINHCKLLDIEVELFQSNHEGVLVDKIQAAYQKFDYLLINAGAYTHTSLAILDAIKAIGIKTIEVHLSDPHQRESYRHFSYISEVALKTFCGEGIQSYIKALDYIKKAGN